MAQLHARQAENPADDQHVVWLSRLGEGFPAGIYDCYMQPVRMTRCAWRQRPLLHRRQRRRPWGLQRPLGKYPVHARIPRNLFVWRFITPCKQYKNACTSRSSHRRGFAGPYVTSVGGTTSQLPEVTAALRGWLLVPLSTPNLPEGRCPHLPPEPRRPVCWPLQVRSLP